MSNGKAPPRDRLLWEYFYDEVQDSWAVQTTLPWSRQRFHLRYASQAEELCRHLNRGEEDFQMLQDAMARLKTRKKTRKKARKKTRKKTKKKGKKKNA